MTDPEDVPRKTKHARRSEATRQDLIDLGLARVPRRGYSARSIRDIVAGGPDQGRVRVPLREQGGVLPRPDRGTDRTELAIGDFVLNDGAAPQYRERLVQFYDQWVTEIAGWIDVLQEQGLVRVDLPAETLAVMAYATIEGHMVHFAIYGRAAEFALDAVSRILSP